jgi:hypothetical protein
MPKQTSQRCNARIRRTDAARDRAAREGPLTEYLRPSRERCRNWPVRGKKRCRMHGGLSTGPTTAEGMAHTLAAMKAGRARWLAELKAAEKPIPCGRKKGGQNLPADEREQFAYEKRCHQQACELGRQTRAERKAARVTERNDTRRRMEEHARRKARMDAGLPYLTEEEWEQL